MQHDRTLGFIGAGNMANAIIKGLTETGKFTPRCIFACDKSAAAIDSAVAVYGIEPCRTNAEVLQHARTILLAVKPQNLQEVLVEIKPHLADEHLLISIAAGVPLEVIRAAIGRDLPMVRVMPNTPALIQMGVSALAGNTLAGLEHIAMVREIFDAVGTTIEVAEGLMDAVTAVSGSGPGYVFRIMEAMVAAAAALGLREDDALALVTQTFVGAAHLSRESGESLARLREMVTSPGGTTQAALNVMNERGLQAVIEEALAAACRRAGELGLEMKQRLADS